MVNEDYSQLRRQALREFTEESLDAKMAASLAIRKELKPVLDAWASENGLQRHEVLYGVSRRTSWFPTSLEQNNPPIDSIELLLEYVLPENFLPLAILIGTLSSDPEFSMRRLLASLILQELESCNFESASMAANVLDENFARIRILAEKLVARHQNLRAYSKAGANENMKRGETTAVVAPTRLQFTGMFLKQSFTGERMFPVA